MDESWKSQTSQLPAVGTLQIDAEGNIVSAHLSSESCAGLSAQELIGRSIFSLRAPIGVPSAGNSEPQHGAANSATRLHHIIGSHPLMQHLYELIVLVSQTDVTVHICGESGVGKELVADAIHHLSSRTSARFVKLNCSSIPSTLLESALFGHVRGAFTDAHRDSQGYIEYAQGGTIFLDEIGEVSQDLQVKLLRLLQSREYSRLGEAIIRRADVRIITATNRDLKDLVQRGKIRDDFFYRINVFPLTVPPLRNRASDIRLLAEHFIAKCNKRFSRSIEGISASALSALHAYSWPGNVRELENAIEHAFVMTHHGLIQLEHLPETIGNPHRSSIPLHRQLHVSRLPRGLSAQEERSAIEAALAHTHGNKAQAASLLGMSRVGLWKKLKRYAWPGRTS